ncbi:MAG: glycoside hydrolase family 3 C-terminal domain-containing protein [Clostridia bacterium]|nr:glycoside hydrolase family 3 C-terminal domain-containing protein [Clostridia bacterium]
MDNGLFIESCVNAVAEGFTLLQNDGSLPLKKDDKIALFGRAQFEYLKSGTGSGGRVNCPYIRNIHDELSKVNYVDETVSSFYKDYIEKNPFDIGDGWEFPTSQVQPEISKDLIIDAKKRTNKAIYIISRISGECFDCKEEKGNWFLTDVEEQNLAILKKHYKNLIVLINSGNVIDMNFVKKFDLKCVAYIWQGGQEGGLGTVKALTGEIPPSGRLNDTIAYSLSDYPCYNDFGDETTNIHTEDIYVGYKYFETFAPEKVLYPFGYGLNYTTFSQKVISYKKTDYIIDLDVEVTNTGDFNGKDVVEVYLSIPNGKLGKPKYTLVAFKKTKMLKSGEKETLSLSFNLTQFASYDDSGKTEYPFSYVLEDGTYTVFVGKNVKDIEKVFDFKIDTTILIKKLSQCLAPTVKFNRLVNNNGKPIYEAVKEREYDLSERIKNNLPKEVPYTGDKGIKLSDVAEKKASITDFIAQFNALELSYLVKGEGMSSPKASATGTASCFGGLTKKWNDLGLPVITCCDGPSGIRLEGGAPATCIPSGTLLSATWNTEILTEIFSGFARELLSYGVDVVLAPGINIHRSPLCGRNFEYFSEDTFLDGEFATAVAKGFSDNGVFCTLKHFAVNSQETNRYAENEVLSERALREIYLKPFEIAVKSGYVKAIMTSYNRVNGIATAGSYDLTTAILRNEWNYQGFVMSDWWTNIDSPIDKSFGKHNIATMVKAQNDVYMPVSDTVKNDDDVKSALDSGYLTLAELQRSAINIINFAINTLTYKKGLGKLPDDDTTEKTLVFKKDLSKVPSVYCEEMEKRYRDAKKKVIKTDLDDGFYNCEIYYYFEGDVLKQHTILIYLGTISEPIPLVCAGTDGKINKTSLKIYIKKGMNLYVECDTTVEIKIYK